MVAVAKNALQKKKDSDRSEIAKNETNSMTIIVRSKAPTGLNLLRRSRRLFSSISIAPRGAHISVRYEYTHFSMVVAKVIAVRSIA
jgi:hypothetical protein